MLQNILPIKDNFDLFLVDIYGVIWDGGALYPQVKERLLALKEEGKHIVLLSNGAEKEEELDRLQQTRGLIKGVHYDRIVSSGELAYRTFSQDDRAMKYFVYGKSGKELFADSPYKEVKSFKEADFIYVGVPKISVDAQWQDVRDIKPFEEDLRDFLDEDMVLICANPDRMAVVKKGETPVIRQGALAAYYQDLGGDVEFFGKPYPDIFAFALEDYEDIDLSRVLMIGDTLESDILGGQSIGIKTALVVDGMASFYMQEEGQFELMEDYCEDLQIVPDYIIKSL